MGGVSQACSRSATVGEAAQSLAGLTPVAVQGAVLSPKPGFVYHVVFRFGSRFTVCAPGDTDPGPDQLWRGGRAVKCDGL
jgi:hypothetical protein